MGSAGQGPEKKLGSEKTPPVFYVPTPRTVCIGGCVYPLFVFLRFTLTNACAFLYHRSACPCQPSVLAPLEPTHLGPPPRRVLRPLSPRRESRDRHRRTPCTCCAADRARRYCRRRIPCTGCAAARACRCRYHRSPCTCCAVARARRCRYRRSPCTGCASARARTSCRRRSPCTCCAPARARRCRCRRNPCKHCAAARARRSCCRRSPCTWCAAARARRSCCRRSPCTSCAPARARTSCLPCPRSFVTRSDGATRWYMANALVDGKPRATLPCARGRAKRLWSSPRREQS